METEEPVEEELVFAACARNYSQKPQLERSISGKRVHTTIKCDFLPPLNLEVTLPVTYPSQFSPLFHVSCVWLSNEQLSRICLKLDEIWNENCNMCVLFTWLDWLQTNLLEYLELFEQPDKVILTPINIYSDDLIDKRAECLFISLDDLIFQFLRYIL